MRPLGLVRPFGVLAFVLAVSLAGCVNVNDTNVPVTNYESSVKFVNLSDAAGSMAVVIDSANNPVTSPLTVNYGPSNASAYVTVLSGIRRFRFTFGSAAVDTFAQALISENKYSCFVVSDGSAGVSSRTYVFAPERYTFSEKGVKDSILVRFLNLSADTTANISGGVSFILTLGTKDSTFTDPIVYPSGSGYFQVAASANPKYSIMAADGSTLIIDHVSLNGQAMGRYSVIIYGSGNNVTSYVLKED